MCFSITFVSRFTFVLCKRPFVPCCLRLVWFTSGWSGCAAMWVKMKWINRRGRHATSQMKFGHNIAQTNYLKMTWSISRRHRFLIIIILFEKQWTTFAEAGACLAEIVQKFSLIYLTTFHACVIIVFYFKSSFSGFFLLLYVSQARIPLQFTMEKTTVFCLSGLIIEA